MKTIYTMLLLLFAAGAGLPALNAQIPNSNFVNWTLDVDSNLNPDGWETSNSFPDISVLPDVMACDQDTSMRLQALLLGGSFVIPGFGSLGFHSSLRPASLSFNIKASVMNGDEVIIFFSAYAANDSLVASPDSCTFKLNSSIASCTNMCLPIKYLNNQTIDSMNISIIVGRPNNAQVGTEITIDNLSFDCFTTGVAEPPGLSGELVVFPNPANDAITLLLPPSAPERTALTVIDIYGQKTATFVNDMTGDAQRAIAIPVSQLSNGMYYYLIKEGAFERKGKFMVSH